MIKPQLNIASICDEEGRQQVMLKVFAKRLTKIIEEFGMYPTVVQVAPGKPPKKTKWIPIGKFLVVIKDK